VLPGGSSPRAPFSRFARRAVTAFANNLKIPPNNGGKTFERSKPAGLGVSIREEKPSNEGTSGKSPDPAVQPKNFQISNGGGMFSIFFILPNSQTIKKFQQTTAKKVRANRARGSGDFRQIKEHRKQQTKLPYHHLSNDISLLEISQHLSNIDVYSLALDPFAPSRIPSRQLGIIT
jgi:hypothetical protein